MMIRPVSLIAAACLMMTASTSTAGQSGDRTLDMYNAAKERCGLLYDQEMQRLNLRRPDNYLEASKAYAGRKRQACDLDAEQRLQRAQMYERQRAARGK